MYLGLDASSSIVGYTLLDKDKKLVDIGFLNLKNIEDLYEKVEFCREWLLDFQKTYSIEDLEVFIEEPLMMFSRGGSMAQVLAKLQRFNGMLSAAIFIDLGVKPKLINVSHARKLCNIKVVRGGNTKEIVWSHVRSLNIIPEEKWTYKKTGSPKDTNFDMADSFVVAMAGALENDGRPI